MQQALTRIPKDANAAALFDQAPGVVAASAVHAHADALPVHAALRVDADRNAADGRCRGDWYRDIAVDVAKQRD